jgi:hypothetical protein
MNDLPKGYHRAEQDYLNPPDPDESYSVLISAWIPVFHNPVGSTSLEEDIKEQIENGSITIHDLDDIEVMETDPVIPYFDEDQGRDRYLEDWTHERCELARRP